MNTTNAFKVESTHQEKEKVRKVDDLRHSTLSKKSGLAKWTRAIRGSGRTAFMSGVGVTKAVGRESRCVGGKLS